MWKTARRKSCAAGGKSSKQKLRQFGLARINPSLKWISLFAEAKMRSRKSDLDHFPNQFYLTRSSRAVFDTIVLLSIPFQTAGRVKLPRGLNSHSDRPQNELAANKVGLAKPTKERNPGLKRGPLLCVSNIVLTGSYASSLKRHTRLSHNARSTYCLMESAIVSVI
jgi:hypothetical protein